MQKCSDKFKIGGKEFDSRLLIGSALYPSPAIMEEAIKSSNAQIVTVSLRRQGVNKDAGESFWNIIRSLGVEVLPNTAGCHSAKEAITIAKMSREVFQTDWIKLEVIGNQYNLQPDPYETISATKKLVKDGFEVFAYMIDDLVMAHRLVDAGCKILMPWGSPIGSGRGLANPYNLKTLREAFPKLNLIIDAGIGRPSDALKAMELGYDGVLINSAVALSKDPVSMAKAFSLAVNAGRMGYKAGIMPKRELASPSTPVVGTPFWHQNF